LGRRPTPPCRSAVRRARVGWRGALAAASLLALGAAWVAGFALAGDHRDLVVELRNREVARIPLDRDAPPRYLEVELPGTGGCRATIEVRSGRARILPIPEQYCPRGICSHTGWIERPGQAAICLPNRLVIRVIERPR
ncbi:MAG: NusG domain II-containing protein, partial [Bacillota bacterium]|nr:NusG domain II-containing protein [Bacillota bacterium]